MLSMFQYNIMSNMKLSKILNINKPLSLSSVFFLAFLEKLSMFQYNIMSNMKLAKVLNINKSLYSVFSRFS